MMNYPKNCVFLTEREMEYTTGGSMAGAVLLAGGLAGGIFTGMIASRQLAQVQKKLKEKNPNAYLPESDAMSKKLEQDARQVFRDSAAGLAINVAQGVAGFCIGFGFVTVLMDLLVGDNTHVPGQVNVPNGDITLPK